MEGLLIIIDMIIMGILAFFVIKAILGDGPWYAFSGSKKHS